MPERQLSGSLAGGVSGWVERWAAAIPPAGCVLDLAAGGGRHTAYLAARGLRVEAVDRDLSQLGALAGQPNVALRQADLESGPWPYAGESFAGVVVTNYLHRPLFPRILAALEPAGLLIYETFMAGNERYGRPGNPDFLLQPNELLDLVAGQCEVLGFEQGYASEPRPAMVQRICARKMSAGS